MLTVLLLPPAMLTVLICLGKLAAVIPGLGAILSKRAEALDLRVERLRPKGAVSKRLELNDEVGGTSNLLRKCTAF